MVILYRILKIILIFLGGLFTILIILSFTSAPFWIWYDLSTSRSGIHRPPDFIIVLGGGGMPSESGLMRTWYTAKIASHFTRAKIIIALPGDTADPGSSVNGMKDELILHGIAQERIILEDSGTNTRAQAIFINMRITNYELRMSPKSSFVNRHSSILIVTSPEHLFRAVLAFRKVGFRKTDGIPAFEQAIESDITFNAGKLGGRRWIPDVGNNLSLRYEFWTQIRYEQLLLREYLAIGYYWVKGWI